MPGFGHHPAGAALLEQVIAQQARDLALDGTMRVAARRHRDRFAVDQLPGAAAAIARVPGEEFVQRHASRRAFAEGDHGQV